MNIKCYVFTYGRVYALERKVVAVNYAKNAFDPPEIEEIQEAWFNDEVFAVFEAPITESDVEFVKRICPEYLL